MKMSNEGQELLILLIGFFIIIKLMCGDPNYSTNGKLDYDKILNILINYEDEIEGMKEELNIFNIFE